MAQSVLVIAESGSGKSTSIRNLDPNETVIINIAKYIGWRKKLYGPCIII